jgi:uroporphyrinogen-III synthase
VAVAAISAAAADAAGGGWAAIEAAETPTDDALLALVARLCNKPRP